MKKYIVAIIFLLIICVFTSCSENKNDANEMREKRKFVRPETVETQMEKRDNCDFRSARWGDSLEEVKKYETNMQFTGETSEDILGKDHVYGYDLDIIYCFENNELFMAAYMIQTDTYNTTEEYIEVYEDLKEKLNNIYGKPVIEDDIWYNTDEEFEITDFINALEQNLIEYMTTWKTYTTEISMVVDSTDGKTRLMISYIPIESSSNIGESFIENTENDRTGCDFRNTKWGDTREAVKKYDTTIKIEEENNEIIAGRDSVSGYRDVVVGYTFDNSGRLFRGSYIFLYKERDAWKLITAYKDLLEKLTDIYGIPDQSEIVPLTMQDLIDLADPSTALELGYVMYISTWTTDTTSINMNLITTNYQPTLGIVYQDLNYQESNNGL